jgi:hypothetical protein
LVMSFTLFLRLKPLKILVTNNKIPKNIDRLSNGYDSVG